ncbi:tetratricopeptide repeat protein [Silanimonas lenta]|uniref:tetratricopeptide repeat protein n=1 Tax=Silanimonas lenta TaxID=265429 RepID=UPI002FE395F9
MHRTIPRILGVLAVAAGLALSSPAGASSSHDAAPSLDPPGVAPADRLDADPAARYIPLPINVPPGSAQIQRLRLVERALRRHPDHPALLRERAFIRYKRGEVDAAEADYARALQVAGDDALLRRHVLWSQGWSRFDAGNDASALAVWREAVALHGGEPFWWPYTAALAEWRLGRRDEAVALYGRAVRGMPEWGSEDGFTLRTRHWPEQQFSVASAVFRAWQAQKAAAVAAAP